MHSDDYPVQGCSCCDTFEPIADKVHNYSIFQTCVDDTTSASTYQKCFNEVNRYQHNALRKKHGVKKDLIEDKTLAAGAVAHAQSMQSKQTVVQDTVWLASTAGALCGESVVLFDYKSAPGLEAINW